MLKALAILIGWVNSTLKWWHDQQQREQGREQEIVRHEQAVKADEAVADSIRVGVADQLRSDPAAIRAPDEFERPD